MAKYHLTRKAVEGLTKIWNYTYDKWSEQQADKYYELLLISCQGIANNPGLGKNYNDVKNGLFGLKTHRNIIFYRKLTDKSVEITGTLHELMDLKNRIAE